MSFFIPNSPLKYIKKHKYKCNVKQPIRVYTMISYVSLHQFFSLFFSILKSTVSLPTRVGYAVEPVPLPSSSTFETQTSLYI